jgi:hypothetical protein
MKVIKNPFRVGSISFDVARRLLSGASFSLRLLFRNLGCKDPLSIINDLRKKGLPIAKDKETGNYSLRRLRSTK